MICWRLSLSLPSDDPIPQTPTTNHTMKTNSILDVARDYNCTLTRACYEILTAAGKLPRRYPAIIRRQPIPPALIRQARWHQGRVIKWSGYSPINGPVGNLP